MKISKFREQLIAFILKQLDDGARIEDVCRKAGVSQQTYYRWRKLTDGLQRTLTLHSALGYRSPEGFETQLAQQAVKF